MGRVGGALRRLGLSAALAIASLAALLMPTASRADVPADKQVTAPLVTPSSAWTYYGSGTTHTNGIAAFSQTPPEIRSLARSLSAGGTLPQSQFVQNVADWVRNNVETEFRFGLSKGGRGAVIDESGTPFDAAELMVKVLRAGGATYSAYSSLTTTVSYQVGTITLGPQDFGSWSGFVTGVTQATPSAAQSFTVSAAAACQFLADGGIPATVNSQPSCSGLSGNLTSVTMAHIWVVVGSTLYDPSFKHHTFKVGMNLASAMGCGSTQAACGTQVLNATLTGATVGTTTFTGQSGSVTTPSITSANETATEAQLATDATNLQQTVQSTNPAAKLDDIVGGMEVDASFAPQGGANLPYSNTGGSSNQPTSTQYTWSGDVPDQFRTQFSMQYAQTQYGQTGPFGSFSQSFFADETATRRVRLQADNATLSNVFGQTVTSEYALNIDGVVVATATCPKCGQGFPAPPPGYAPPYATDLGDVTLSVQHPYAAQSGAYASATSVSQDLALPLTLVQGWGDSSPSMQKFVADRSIALGDDNSSASCPHHLPNGDDDGFSFCGDTGQAGSAATLLVQRTSARQLVQAVGQSRITNHHALGVVFANQALTVQDAGFGGQMAYGFDVRSVSSVDAVSGGASAPNFEAYTLLSSALEGSVGQQSEDSVEAMSAVSAVVQTNRMGAALVDISPSQATTVFGSNPSGDEWIGGVRNGSGGYLAGTAPTIFSAGFGFQSGQLSYIVNGVTPQWGGPLPWWKGGGGQQSTDPVDSVMKTIKQSDVGVRKKSYASVNLSTGGLTFTPPPDLITGVGDFPYSLPFQRTYESEGGNYETPSWRGTAYQTNNSPGGDNNLNGYRGPDQDTFSHLGGGWVHNYEIAARLSSDGERGFGRVSGIDASSAIAATYTLTSLLNSPSLSQRVSAIFTGYWLTTQFINNVVIINRGSSSEAFYRLPNGTSFHAPPGSADQLSQSSVRNSISYQQGVFYQQAYDYSAISFNFTGKDGDTIHFDWASKVNRGDYLTPITGNLMSTPFIGEPIFKADTWTFPSGVIITFNYFQDTYNPNDQAFPIPAFKRYVLQSVTNNLGRSLTFSVAGCTTCSYSVWDPTLQQTDVFGNNYGDSEGRPITGVSDENGRTVGFAVSGCPTASDQLDSGTHQVFIFDCPTFAVTAPDSTTTTYTYQPGTDSPDPAWVDKPSYYLRRWFTPSNTGTAYETFAFDSDYRAATATDVLGHQTQYFAGGFADEWMKHAYAIDPAGATSQAYFDQWNSNVVSIDPLGRTSAKAFDGMHRLVLAADPLMDCSATLFDARSNELQKSSYPAGACTLTGQVLLPTSSFPGAPVTVFPSSAPTPIVTSATYGLSTGDVSTPASPSTVVACTTITTCNKMASATDALGNTATYSWNASTGQLTQVLQPAVWSPADGANEQPKMVLGYASFNGVSLLTSKQDFISASVSTTTAYAYNSANKYVLQTATVDSGTGKLNLTATFTFDAVGNLTAVQSPRTDVTSVSNYTWDVDRRPVFAIQPAPSSGVMVATRNTYDVDSELIEIDKGTTTSTTGSGFTPLETTTFAFDLAGNKIQTLVMNGTSLSITPLALAQVGYDADDRPICSVVRMNPSAFAGLEATAVSGSSAASTLPTDACTLGTAGSYGNDRITQTNYDAAGQTTSTIKALHDVLQETYEAFTYTQNGKQQTIADAVGNLTTYYYDGFNRLVQTNFPSTTRGAGTSDTTAAPTNCNAPASGANVERYCYDANGARTDLFKRDQTHLSFAHDALGRETTKTVPQITGPSFDTPITAYTVNTQYDLLGRKSSVAFSGGLGLSYAYDNAGRLISETTGSRTLSYQYDGGGDRTRVTWPDGFYAAYAYDPVNRLTGVTDSGSVSVASFSYDSLGRRSQLSRGNGLASTYSYDNADRLTCVAQNCAAGTGLAFTYAYSPAGQDLTKATSADVTTWSAYTAGTVNKTYDGLNRDAAIAAVGTGPCGVANGYDCNGSLLNNGTTAYAYDQENRLLKAAVSSTGAALDTLSYDPLGRLNQTVTPSGGTTSFLYDGDRLSAEYSGSGVLLRRYIHGVGTDEPLAWYDYSGGPLVINWLHADRQGSIVAASVSAGTLTQYPYGPYGEPQTWSGSRFAYTGQIMLPEAQLYHYKARAYDPIAGRFMQTDPVGYKSDVDLYGYVGGDPTDRSDPTGEQDMGIQAYGDSTMIAAMCKGDTHCMANYGTAYAAGAVLPPVAFLTCIAGGCEAIAGWVTINSPSLFNWAAILAGEGWLVGNAKAPLGFTSATFAKFSSALESAFENAGLGNVSVFMRGSSVTGVKYGTDVLVNAKTISDYDVAIVSKSLLAKVAAAGSKLRGGGTRSRAFDAEEMRRFGVNLPEQANGKTVTYMIYDSVESVKKRGTTLSPDSGG